MPISSRGGVDRFTQYLPEISALGSGNFRENPSETQKKSRKHRSGSENARGKPQNRGKKNGPVRHPLGVGSGRVQTPLALSRRRAWAALLNL